MIENNEIQILENNYINYINNEFDKNEFYKNELIEEQKEETKIINNNKDNTDNTDNEDNILKELKEKYELNIENKVVENPKTEITLKTKDDLICHIKEWIKIDKEINICKSELKEKIALKKLLSTNLIDVMKNNKIDCFDINGGSLIYKKSKVKKSISCKLLLNELEKIYKDQPELAKNLGEQIMNAREEKVNEFIKVKINK